MPPIALALPVALPVAAGALAVVANRLGSGACRAIAAAGVWAGAAAIVGLWAPLRSTLELSLGTLGFGVALGLRLDAVAVVFGLALLIPIAILLTVQPRTWQESAVIALAVRSARFRAWVGRLDLRFLTVLQAWRIAGFAFHTDPNRGRAPRLQRQRA